MYLCAVLVPPLVQREEVARLLTEVGARMGVASTPAPARETRRRARAAPPAAVQVPAALQPLPVGVMALHLTRFGYVDPPTADGLRARLERDAASWTAPMVRFVGRVSTNGTDERLHLAVDGDVDGLRAVFREITDSARRAGFMLDRRSFVPLIPVATLDDAVSDDALATLVAGLEGFAGTPWQARVVTLSKLGFGPADEALEAVARIPIGSPAG